MALKSQSEGVVTYVGHASTVIELDGVRLLTDPVLRGRIVHLKRHALPPQASAAHPPDAVLLSHMHFDHVDIPTLRRLGRDVRIVTPPGSLALLRRKGFRRVEELPIGAATQIGKITVTAVPAEHDGRRWSFMGSKDSSGYLVEGTRRVYFAGDTDIYDDMASSLGGLDLALLPVWGWGHNLGPGHMDPEAAARAAALFRPRLAVPIHWGTLYPIGLGRWAGRRLERPPHEFAEFVADYSPETEVRVLEPGSSTAFDGPLERSG